MTPQPGLQAIAVHILTNISRRKGSQAIKFRGETIRRPLSEKSKSSFIQFGHFWLPNWRAVTKLQTTCLLLTHIKLFWKTKRGLELVFLPQFLRHFWRKIFLLYSVIFYYLTKFHCLVVIVNTLRNKKLLR